MKSRIGKYCSSMVESIPLFAGCVGLPRPSSPCPLLQARTLQRPALSGADGETRTPTANATAPSRQRVYQFHHVGYFGTSLGFESDSFLGAAGAAGAVPCGTSPGFASFAPLLAGGGADWTPPSFLLSFAPVRAAASSLRPWLDRENKAAR